MTRTRISTTVDSELLAAARQTQGGGTDATLVDAALAAFIAERRAAQIDAAYDRAYDAHPLDEPDEWGDLESFRRGASS